MIQSTKWDGSIRKPYALFDLKQNPLEDEDRNLINHPRSGISVSKYGYTENGHPKDTLNYNAEMVQI